MNYLLRKYLKFFHIDKLYENITHNPKFLDWVYSHLSMYEMFDRTGLYENFAYIKDFNGNTFMLNNQLSSMLAAYKEYDYNFLHKDDKVIDLGANCGAFCIPASRKVKHIIAVEPLFFEELVYNIGINKIKNILCFQNCISNNIYEFIQYYNRCSSNIKGITLSSLIKCFPNHKTLKCDIEGYEYIFTPSELLHFDKIIMEIHYIQNSTKKSDNWFDEFFVNNGYKYYLEEKRLYGKTIHVYR